MRVLLCGKVSLYCDEFFKYVSLSMTKTQFDLVLVVGSIDIGALENLSKHTSKDQKLNSTVVLFDETLTTAGRRNTAQSHLEVLFRSVYVCDPMGSGQQLPCGCFMCQPVVPHDLKTVWLVPGARCQDPQHEQMTSFSGGDIQRLLCIVPDKVDMMISSFWPQGIVNESESGSEFIAECTKMAPHFVGKESNCVTEMESIIRPTYTVSNSVGVHLKNEERVPTFVGLAHMGWRAMGTLPKCRDGKYSLKPLYARQIRISEVLTTSSLVTDTVNRDPSQTKRINDSPLDHNHVKQARGPAKVNSATNPFGVSEDEVPLYNRYMDPVGQGVLRPPSRPPSLNNSNSPREIVPPCKTLGIFNLPFRHADAQLTEMLMNKFQQFQPQTVRYVSHTEEFRRGRCYVDFPSIELAEKGIKTIGTSFEFEGRTVRIDFAKSNISREPNQPCQISINAHADCWFCISNPDVEKNLIVDFPGSPFIHYTSLAKGGYNDCHLLVTPVTHYPGSPFCSKENNQKLIAATKQVKAAIRFEGYRYIYLWERYFPMRHTNTMHMQIQIVGLQQPLLQPFDQAVATLAQDCRLTFEALPAGTDLSIVRDKVADLEDAYTYVEYGSCEEDTKAYLHIKPRGVPGRMPINLGRELLCCANGNTKLINWKECQVPEEQMNGMTKRWNGVFAKVNI